MKTATSLAIYDPRRLDDRAFLAGFVARIPLVEELLGYLAAADKEHAGPHVSIVGQRGMGKTSLLRRIELGILSDPELADDYIPLTFREEQYNVRSLGRFWRNCGEALAEWADDTGQADLASSLDRRLDENIWHDGQAAGESLQKEIAKLGKRPVLLVDNFDLVLGALNKNEVQVIKNDLARPGGPILFSASVSDISLAELSSTKFAFHIRHLDPLSLNELMYCMQRLSALRGRAGRIVAQILEKEPHRLQTMHLLTGGNPRVLALLYQLLERAETDSVFEDLEALLDQLTPFYKARVEDYSSELQRSIIDAVALNWDPIVAKAIAVETGIATTTLPAQLKRLTSDGILQEVRVSNGRIAYQLAERFFNIWYLMRHGTRRTRHRMKWLAAFLQSFYAVEELRSMRASSLKAEGSKTLHPLFREALDSAIERQAQVRLMAILEGLSSIGVDESPAVLLDRQEAVDLTNDMPESAEAWLLLGIACYVDKDFKSAHEAAIKAIGLQPDHPGALFAAAYTAEALQDFQKAAAYFKRSLEVDAKQGDVWESLGNLLAYRMDNLEEAKSAFRQAIKFDKNLGVAWLGLAYVFNKEGAYFDAAAASEKSVHLDPDNAAAWAQLAMARLRLGEFETAIVAVQKALSLESDPSGWSALAAMQLQLGRVEAAATSISNARSIEPENPHFMDVSARVAAAQGLSGDARKLFEDALAHSPHDDSVKRHFSEFLIETGHHDEACSILYSAVEDHPENDSNWALLGNCLADHVDAASNAEAIYREGLAKHPDNRLIKSNLIWLLLREGRVREAVLIRKDLKIDKVGLNLIDSVIALLGEDFLKAEKKFVVALSNDLELPNVSYFEDLLRLIKVALEKKELRRVLKWIESNSLIDQQRPVYIAVKALVDGESQLLDVSPEVRDPAEKILRWLEGTKASAPS